MRLESLRRKGSDGLLLAIDGLPLNEHGAQQHAEPVGERQARPRVIGRDEPLQQGVKA